MTRTKSNFGNRKPLIEKLDERRCLAFGVMDASFGTAGYVESSYAQTTNAWNQIAGLFENEDGLTQVLRISSGSAPGFAIANIDADGALTQDFDGDGIAYAFDPARDDQLLGFEDGVRLADGSFVARTTKAGAAESSLIGILPDGSINPNFGSGGAVRLPSSFFAARIFAHPNNGFFLSFSNSGSNATNEIWKYQSDGSIDRAYGLDGQLIVPRMAINPPIFDLDGRTTWFGDSFDRSTSTKMFTQLRFLNDGARDTTFGPTGELTTEHLFGNASKVVYSSATNSFVGHQRIESSAAGTSYELKSILTTGELNEAFGDQGTAILQIPGFATQLSAFDLTVAPSGRLIGSFIERHLGTESRIILVGVTPEGELDTTFGTGGIISTNILEALQARRTFSSSTGELYVYGETFTNGFNPWILKFTADGQVDRTFDSDGFLARDYTPSSRGIQTLQLNSLTNDRWLLSAGWESASPRIGTSVLLANDGSKLDEFRFGGFDTPLQRIVSAPDGGWFSIAPNQPATNAELIVIRKYFADGELDASFGLDGVLSLSSARIEDMHASVESDGSALVFARASASDSTNIALHGATVAFRLLPTGLDPNFATNGVLRLADNGLTRGYATPDGFLLQFTSFTTNSDTSLHNYLRNGSLNSTFGSNGVVLLQPRVGEFKDGAVDELGRLLILGKNEGRVQLFRVGRTGQLDTSFGTAGVVAIPLNDESNQSMQMDVRRGVIAIAGTDLLGTDSRLRLVAIGDDGTLLPELDGDGIKDFAITDSLESAVDLAFAEDGDILLGVTLRNGVDRVARAYRLGGSENPVLFNWDFPLDVNNDGIVAASDVLVIVNFLNGLELPTGVFPDTTNNGFVSANDSLIVINHLNSRAGSSEGEGVDDDHSTLFSSPSDENPFLTGMFFFDFDQLHPSRHSKRILR